MSSFLYGALSAQAFMPHGMCYLWQPGVLTLHVASDALIAAAYFSIPFTLTRFLRKRRDLEFDWVIACFALFIVACGMTHLMEIITIWYPVYWTSGAIKAVTAAASLPTAALLVKLLPKAVRWPGPATLRRAHDELQQAHVRLLTEAAERQRAQEEAQRVNYELQEQLADMRRLHEISMQLLHTHELPTMLEQILESTISLQHADFGSVQLYDAASRTLQVVAQRGFSSEFMEHSRRVAADDVSASGRALLAGRRVIIEDVTADAGYAPYLGVAAREGYRGVHCTPILGRDGGVKGILATHFRAPCRLPETDLQMTDLYMRLAADSLERVQNEAALCAARDEADRANLAKGRFLATASHDLRQPLQALSLLNGSLRRLATDAEEQVAIGEQHLAITAMSRLLNSILDISKLESGAITPQLQDFDLAALFVELRVEFAEVARKKGLQLVVAEESALVHSDRALLGQILRNLVSNAIRYTARGAIQVRLQHCSEQLRVEVEDSGIGIAPEQVPLIFDEFYQVSAPPNTVREGHGLGLSIVQRAARLLSHPLSVRSVLGQGSVFAVLVPAGTASAAAVTDAAPAPGPEGQRPHVLVVDDDPGVLNATRTLLRVEGFQVSAAGSLPQALRIAATHADLGLLITDYHLGNGELGTRVIEAVREVLGQSLRAVLISGDTSGAPKSAVRDECTWLLRKPVNPEELLALLDTVLEAGAPA